MNEADPHGSFLFFSWFLSVIPLDLLLVSPIFSFTSVAASSEHLTIVSKGGAFSPRLFFSPPSILSLFLSLSLPRLLDHSFFSIR